jgi:uncharacterized protein (DUF433 family)
MKYSAINIQGNIITSDILEKIRTEDIPYQKPIDFGLNPNTVIRDEVGLAWALATSHWKAFQQKRENLLDTETGTSETRRMWLIPFLQLLGYDISVANAEMINGKSYAISHRATNLDGFPIHIVGVNQELDSKNEGARLSPHALGQEYLNNHEHLYALVSNGKYLRLLRDATKLSQLSYLEFNLQQIFEEGLYAEFALLFRLLHSSRLPVHQELGPQSILEFYHQEAIESGARIRDRLSDAVENSLKEFANGFIKHPDNSFLVENIRDESLTARKFYQVNLRLIYRLLFLMVTEERKLIYPSSETTNKKSSEIYYSYYSLHRLTEMAEKLYYIDRNKSDLWQSLLSTFRLFEDEAYGKPLNIQPLGSGIFSTDALGLLSDLSLDNESVLSALKFFTSFVNENKQVIRVNYADLNVEELGSVYEGLLDLEPVFYNIDASKIGDIIFDLTSEGTERKTTGSYYTKPELVNELIKSSLVPVIRERLEIYDTKKDQIKALLSLKICDPAAGSGHMLLAAARTIAWEVASLRSKGEHPEPPIYRESLREVINHCLYAVDFNPEAVELCKLALWLEGHNSGKPLSFLDHKIRNGNSLVGVPNLNVLDMGIPAGAFNPITGDEKEVTTKIKKQNTAFLKTKQFSFDFAEEKENITKDFNTVSVIDQDTMKAVKLAKKQFEDLRLNNKNWFKTWTACNIWTSAFFIDYIEIQEKALPTSEALFNYIKRPAAAYGPMVGMANSLAMTHKFFHWPLEFPDVYEQGGFDVMLGNPPWERIKLQEKEFFKGKNRNVEEAGNASKRKREILKLKTSDLTLYDQYLSALKTSEATSKFLRDSTLFPLTGRGDINTYSIFAELFSNRINKKGASGFIVPTGIATDDNNKYFFANIVENGRLITFFDFENKKAIFQDVHRNFKFSLISIGSFKRERFTKFGFYLHDVNDLQDKRRVFTLSKDDFLKINPNTKTTPIFRTQRDAELTAKIYARIPILVNERKMQNTWKVNFMRMFDMSNDAHLFKTENELVSQGYSIKGNRFNKDKIIFLPLYESKMIWNYNHRYGSFKGIDVRTATHTGSNEECQDPKYQIKPWYWVEEEEVNKQTENKWNIGFRGITNVSNERTSIFSILPKSGVGNSMPIITSTLPRLIFAILPSITSSLVFDFISRNKIAWTNFNFFYLMQMPLMHPKVFSEHILKEVLSKSLELAYTSWDIKSYADEIWMEAPMDLRTAISRQWKENKMETGGHQWVIPEWSSAYPEIAWDKEIGCPLPPFKWDEERRLKLMAELDAYFALLYGLEKDELQYILDPHSIYGDDFPSESFRVLKEKDIKKYGEYRTQRLVLEAYDRLRPTWNMPEHLEKLKTIWEECQVDLSEVKEEKRVKEKTKSLTKPKTKEKQSKEVDLFTEIPQTMKAFSEHDGIYSINDAATIINKSNDRVRRWFKELSKINYEGLDDKEQTDIDKRRISFLGLIELVVIGELIDNGFKIRKVFQARESLAEITGLIYPFATDRVDKSLKLVGNEITWEFEQGNITLNGKNQFNLDFIRNFFKDIVFQNGLAKSILSSRGNKRVEITPKVAGGKPAIINSNGIEVETILRHYHGEDSIDELIADYGISKEDINAAIAYQS